MMLSNVNILKVMKMIFLGDIAIPHKLNMVYDLPLKYFEDKLVIANLEGAIYQGDNKEVIHKPILFNSVQTLSIFDTFNIKIASIANNHFHDLKGLQDSTNYLLKSNGIQVVGAGKNLNEAKKYIKLEYLGEEIIILSFGWNVIGCQYASHNTSGVNPLTWGNVIGSITQTRESFPNSRIVCLCHWNYELELYPQPLHREMAKAAIEAGADIIVGHHPHCIQGIEIYQEKPIVYSLGNWLIPHKTFLGGKLSYPSKLTEIQLALQWNPKTNKITCHWYKYSYTNNQHLISHIQSEDFTKSQHAKELTPFYGLSSKAYQEWFVKNRRQKKFLPIFTNTDSQRIYQLKAFWVLLRQRLISLLVMLGVK